MNLDQKLEKAFDLILAQANDILAKANPCQHSTKCGKHSCIGMVMKDWATVTRGNEGVDACCTGCQYLGPKGCIADGPLFCKLWLCTTAQNLNPETYNELTRLRAVGKYFGLLYYREGRAHSLKMATRLWVGFKHFNSKLCYSRFESVLDVFIEEGGSLNKKVFREVIFKGFDITLVDMILGDDDNEVETTAPRI